VVNFVYLRSSTLHFSNFCLDSCIGNKGGDGCEGNVLIDAFGRFSGGFEPIPSICCAQLVTGLTGGGH
jgi:hypothetical protein